MTDNIPSSAKNDEVKAQVQINDLGIVNRNFITTVDPGFTQVSERVINAQRHCNNRGTQAFQQASTNQATISAWGDAGNFKDSNANSDCSSDDDDAIGFVRGQSHRMKLYQEVGNQDYQADTSGSHRGNQRARHRGSKHAFPSRSMADAPIHGISGRARDGRPPQPRAIQEPQPTRPVLPAFLKSSSSKAKPVPQNNGNSVQQTTATLNNNAPAYLTNPRQFQFVPETVPKKRIASNVPTAAENSPKRTYRYTYDSGKDKGRLTPVSSHGSPKKGRANANHKKTDAKSVAQPQAATCIGSSSRGTKQATIVNAARQSSMMQSVWAGRSLLENTPVIESAGHSAGTTDDPPQPSTLDNMSQSRGTAPLSSEKPVPVAIPVSEPIKVLKSVEMSERTMAPKPIMMSKHTTVLDTAVIYVPATQSQFGATNLAVSENVPSVLSQSTPFSKPMNIMDEEIDARDDLSRIFATLKVTSSRQDPAAYEVLTTEPRAPTVNQQSGVENRVVFKGPESRMGPVSSATSADPIARPENPFDRPFRPTPSSEASVIGIKPATRTQSGRKGPGLAASKYAVSDKYQAAQALTTSKYVASDEYQAATGSEEGFWKWSARQKPNKSDYQKGPSSQSTAPEVPSLASMIPPTNRSGWVNPSFLVSHGQTFVRNPFT